MFITSASETIPYICEICGSYIQSLVAGIHVDAVIVALSQRADVDGMDAHAVALLKAEGLAACVLDREIGERKVAAVPSAMGAVTL